VFCTDQARKGVISSIWSCRSEKAALACGREREGALRFYERRGYATRKDLR
jgi:hypothetical protein